MRTNVYFGLRKVKQFTLGFGYCYTFEFAMIQDSFPWKTSLILADAEWLETVFNALHSGLAPGFELSHSSAGMAWVLPFSLYPAGYHCAPRQPLPFMSLRVQKSHLALYHMGLYASAQLTEDFLVQLMADGALKPDMGKGCLRLKRNRPVPTAALQWLAQQLTPAAYIDLYEAVIKPKG